jgi:isoleucyl-tRNA synthetase
MDLVMMVVKLGRLLRSEHNLKVRQPLSRIHVVSRNKETRSNALELKDIILSELNVKELQTDEDETGLVTLKAKPNFRALGPKWGKEVGAVAGAIDGLGHEAAESLADGNPVEINTGSKAVQLAPEEVVIERIPREGLIVASEGDLVVALETAQTPDLIDEGHAREVVNRIQNLRKREDLHVAQRIRYAYSADEELQRVIDKFSDYISSETLATDIRHVDQPSTPDGWEEADINGRKLRHRLEPAG